MITAEAWQKKEVRQVGEVVTGTTPSTKKPEYYGHEYKLISPADLDNGKYVITAHRMLSALGLEQCRVLPKNTVLVGCIGNVGKIGMVADEHAATNQQINAVICNAEHDPHFVYYSLHYNRQRLEDAAVKTTVPILNKSNFGRFDLVVPPFSEQQRIAYVLSMVQTAIEQQATLITLTRELKSALMDKLFTEGLRGEKQKETEIGLVPERWEEFRLEKTGDVVYGIQAAVANNLRPIGMKILTNKNITLDGQIVLDKINYFELKTKRHFETVLKKGDILFNWRSGSKEHIGKTAYFSLDGDYTHSSFILRIRPNDNVNGRFLFWYLYFLRVSGYFLQKHDISSVNATFNKSAVDALSVFLPSKDEQEEIASILDIVDAKIALLKQKRDVQEELFRTLLHQLMTGQTRVNEIDLPSLS